MSLSKPNRLVSETSPYLLQHSYNPVDWFPWGEEAFEKARSEDKPVLVSIGYSACHWCHVMERESFEDQSVADLMNEHFINIKVDMEERPDVDQIYMNFVQMTSGRGGWPLNVFLTPDKRPFFGGTYFPPEPRYGMPSWRQILLSLADAYREKRDDVEKSANEIVAALRDQVEKNASMGNISAEVADAAFQKIKQTFDAINGGFGGAPKFPSAMVLDFLLRYHHRTGNDNALGMVEFTLEKMSAGGIYDQLGGGFHRYAVDAIWLVPHFEKMLYDNAQLARIYTNAFQVTGNAAFKRTAIETLNYIEREMTDPSGAFYSTQDADSEGEEGKFFVWSRDEIENLIGPDDAKVFNAFYGVTDGGNFEGHTILNRSMTVEAAAASAKIDVAEAFSVIENARIKLFEEREKRIKPGRDEKILTAWNGLMLQAFAEAAMAFGDVKYQSIAVANADFIIRELENKGRLLRTWKDGKAKLQGYLEDYANAASGMLAVYQLTGIEKYFDAARRYADVMIFEFWDELNGGFFFTANDHEDLIVRNKDYFDNATPSGNSAAADVLLRLAKYTGEEHYERFGMSVLRCAANEMRRYPNGFGRMLSAVEFAVSDIRELVIIDDEQNLMTRAAFGSYHPDMITAIASSDSGSSVELVKGKTAISGKPTAYVCQNMVCGRPAASVAEMIDRLK